MNSIKCALASAAIALTAACNHDRPATASDVPAASLVPVSSIVNAVKCELASTFAKNRYVETLVKPPVKATLTLKEVVARKIEGEAGLEFNALGVTVGGTGGASRQRTATNSLKVGFEYLVRNDAPVPAFCAALERSVFVEGEPFVTVLDGIRTEYSEIQHGDPKVQMKSVEYTLGFEIEKEIKAGVEVSVLIFKVGGSGSRTRTSEQELTLEFDISALPPAAAM